MKLPALANLLMGLVITGLILFLIFLVIGRLNKMEGFYPLDDTRIQYEKVGTQRYNKFADTQDPLADGVIPFGASGQLVVDGLLRTGSYESSGPSVKTGSAMDIRFDDPKQFMALPVDPDLLKRIKLCEAVKDWKCEAFQDEDFEKYCGICIDKGETSTGQKIKFGGLYIDPKLREKTVKEANEAGKKPEITPTLGKCAADKFILYRPECDYRKDRYQCANARTIDDPNVIEKCVACHNPPTGRPTFVYPGKRGPKDSGYLQGSKPFVFDSLFRIVTSLSPSRIKLLRINSGAEVEMTMKSTNEFEFLLQKTFESEPFKLTVEYESFSPYEYTTEEKTKINAMAAENKITSVSNIQKMEDASREVCTSDPGRIFKTEPSDKMFYGCGENKCCQRIKPTIKRKFGLVGQFESTVNNRRVFPFDQSITNINGLQISADEGPPRYGTLQSSPIFKNLIQSGSVPRMPSNRFWVWDSDDTKTMATYNFIMPVSFLEVTFPAEDGGICPSGPLISLGESYDRLRTGPCSKLVNNRRQIAGTYTTECAQSLFLKGGCEKEGNAFPTNALKMDALLNDDTKTPLEEAAVVEKVSAQKEIADRPYDSKTDIEQLKQANLFCYGNFDYNPCSGPLEKSGPQTVECLDYLFQNAGKSARTIGPTYTQSSMRSSGSGIDIAKPILYCQKAGTAAPIGKDGKINNAAVMEANKYKSISNIKNYFDSIHRAANFSKAEDEQSEAMLKCYGVTIRSNIAAQTGGFAPPLADKSTLEIFKNIRIFTCPIDQSTEMGLENVGGSAVALPGRVAPGQPFPPVAERIEKDSNRKFLTRKKNNGDVKIKGLINGTQLAINGVNVVFTKNDGSDDFKNESTWRIVNALNGGSPPPQPPVRAGGYVSIQAQNGFYLSVNKLTKSFIVTNDISDKDAVSFFITNADFN